MADPRALDATGAWLLTYALHSTILLGATLLVVRRLRGDAWRETLLKATLVGSLVTASVPASLGVTPLAGRLALPALQTPTGSAPSTPSTRAPSEARTNAARPAFPLLPTLVGVWAAGALLLLMRLGIHHALLFRVLGDRRPARDATLHAMLDRLRRDAGHRTPVRLSVSRHLPTPIALGTREICVPERFLCDLGPEQQQSALAHELAHLRRADPVWQLAAGVLESVFFFQPLNRIARRRLRDAAENLCDDWAVQQTGSPMALARCLTSIASWTGATRIPDTTLAMANGGSSLVRRVARLAEWREPQDGASVSRSVVVAGALLLVAATVPAVGRLGHATAPVGPASEVPGQAASEIRAPTVRASGALEAPPDARVRAPAPGAAGAADRRARRALPAGGAHTPGPGDGRDGYSDNDGDAAPRHPPAVAGAPAPPPPPPPPAPALPPG